MSESFHGTTAREDALHYLPRKPVREFPKGGAIYNSEQSNSNLYVVIMGRVKIASAAGDGGRSVVRLVSPDGMFGEACLAGGEPRAESAWALDHTTVMGWNRVEIERQIEREPQLGIALMQYMVAQGSELESRIASMALCKTPARVMQALSRFAEDLGRPLEDGSVRVESLTHQTIAEYVGTSREIVTYQMNRLRRQGLLRYTRRFIDIRAQALRAEMERSGGEVAHAAGGQS